MVVKLFISFQLNRKPKMKFAFAVLLAVFGIATAQPGFIRDKLREIGENKDYKPVTLIGKAARRVHQLENDPDYEPITTLGKQRKQMLESANNPDVEYEPVTLMGKAVKGLDKVHNDPDYKPKS